MHGTLEGGKSSYYAQSTLGYIPSISSEADLEEHQQQSAPLPIVLKVSDISLQNYCSALDRTDTSSRGGALLATMLLKDIRKSIAEKISEKKVATKFLNLIDDVVIDRSKIFRERVQFRKYAKAAAKDDTLLESISFDGKRELALKKQTVLNKVRLAQAYEEHITILKEPGSKFIAYGTPTHGTGGGIQKAFINFLMEESYSLEHLIAVSCDGTVTNTGHTNGVIALMERHLQRPLQWCICLFHFNELPMTALLRSFFGKQKGPGLWPTDFGKELLECEKYPIADNFEKISKGVLPENIDDWNIRADQRYLFRMVMAVNDGICNDVLASIKPGPLSTARWLTTASRILRLYVSKNCPSTYLKRLAEFVVKLYAPFWFLVKRKPGAIHGSRNVYQYINWMKNLPLDVQLVIRPVVERNSYFFHPENILLSMITDTESDDAATIREDAYSKILSSRIDPPLSVRKFYVPPGSIHFNSNSYVDMIDWNRFQNTEPPCLQFRLQEELQEYHYSNEIIKIPDILCHTQNTERFVHIVSESSLAVTDTERLGHIFAKLDSYEKYSSLESRKDLVTLIYFLLLIPWPHTHIIKYFCSKDNSRLVRKIVRSKWTPILDKYSAKLPLDCPLHPLRDIFAPCQDAKKRDRPTQWTCRLCGKSFYQERFLDLHFETRHKSVINEAEDSICLADFCDIMRCEVFQTEESSSLKTSDQHVVTDIEVWGDSLGQNSALAKANTPYLSLIPLRTSSIGGTRAAKVQSRQLCQDKIGQNKFKDTVENVIVAEKSKTTTTTNNANEPMNIMKNGHDDGEHSTGTPTKSEHNKAANTPKTTTTPTSHNSNTKAKKNGSNEQNNHQDDEDESSKPSGNASRTRNGDGNMQKTRANCKADELRKLKVQCELLVRSCIANLLLTMTDQSFKDMEEEMNRAVCWYLSCDRYWEDGPLEPRYFPWGLALILVFVLSTGVCFCYYIIWILFNSEETTINTDQQDFMYQRYQQQTAPLHHQQQQQQQHHQAYTTTGGMHGGIRQNMSQPYYYQQQAHELYPEQLQYDYRHSPRRYMADTHTQNTSTVADMNTGTPRHRHAPTQSHVYQQDILDRRDYTNRPIATTAVTSGGGKSMSSGGGGSVKSASTSGLGSSGVTMLDNEPNMGAAAAAAASGGGRHYNTHPRPLTSHHRNSGASQHSLRASSSIHEFMQNDIGQNEHYIYVTYPPDLKKRYLDQYE